MRKTLEEQVLRYLDTDLLCYRAARPGELARRQAESWDPPLTWFARCYGGALRTTTELKALSQDRKLHEAVAAEVRALDETRLEALCRAVSLSGSLILGLALIAGEMSPEEVFAAARVEERYKAQIYGEDEHGPDPAQEKKDAALLVDLKAAARFLTLSK